MNDEQLAAFNEMQPLGGSGTPKDIAGAVLYLANASGVTGGFLHVGRGVIAGGDGTNHHNWAVCAYNRIVPTGFYLDTKLSEKRGQTMPLFGIYGKHTTEACPWNNVDTAKRLLKLALSDFDSRAKEYKINKIVGQYHSALEHTFLWVVEAADPHLIQEFCVATGVATINELKIVPLITFREGVIPGLKKIHSL